MWARLGVSSTHCPKSVITAQSLDWLEQFVTWKQIGLVDIEAMDAKTAEALVVLNQAWLEEMRREEE